MSRGNKSKAGKGKDKGANDSADYLTQLSTQDVQFATRGVSNGIKASALTIDTYLAIHMALKSDCPTVGLKGAEAITRFLKITREPDLDGISCLMMGNDEFVPLLKKWLTVQKPASNCLKLQGLLIMSTIASSPQLKPHLELLKSGGIIPALVGTLTASDTNICDHGLNAIESMIFNEYLVKELINTSGFVPAISKLSKRDNPTLVFGVVSVLFGLSKQRMSLALTSANVKSMIPMFRDLMDVKDAKVLAFTVHCIGMFSSGVDGAFDMFAKAGFVLKVAALLSNPTAKDIYVEVSLSIVGFAINKDKALALFKLLKGTDHLKHYYPFWIKKQYSHLWKASKQVLYSVLSLLHNSFCVATAQTLLNCGIVHSLVQCLRKNVLLEFQQVAGTILTQIATLLKSPAEKKMLAETGVIPFCVDLLRSTDEIVITMAVSIIGSLVMITQCRDQVFSLGGVKLLLELLKKYKMNLNIVRPILASFPVIMICEPKAPVEAYLDFPETINTIVDCHKSELITEFATVILYNFEEYVRHGPDAMEKLMKSRAFHKLIPLISSSADMLKQAVCTALMYVLENTTKEHKQSILETDILPRLEGLLKDSAKPYRIVAINVLLALLEAKLAFTEAHATIIRQKLLVNVKKELNKNDPDTQMQAFCVVDICKRLFVNLGRGCGEVKVK